MKTLTQIALRRYTRSTPPRDGVRQGRGASMRDVNSSDGARLGEGVLARSIVLEHSSHQRIWRPRLAAAALRYWRRIGGLLKAVDGGLLGDWVEWSQLGQRCAAGVTRASDVFEWAQPLKAPASPANATAVWCALAPRGCDVSRHPSCGGVSALRASLVKVLGSSCDLASAFERLRKRLAASGGDVPPTVTARDLRRCCHEGGLALSREEARQLIDCIALRG